MTSRLPALALLLLPACAGLGEDSTGRRAHSAADSSGGGDASGTESTPKSSGSLQIHTWAGTCNVDRDLSLDLGDPDAIYLIEYDYNGSWRPAYNIQNQISFAEGVLSIRCGSAFSANTDLKIRWIAP